MPEHRKRGGELNVTERIYSQIFKKNVKILDAAVKTVRHIRKQEYLYADRSQIPVINLLSDVTGEILSAKDWFSGHGCPFDESGVVAVLSMILEAKESGDYIYAADLYECQLIPFIKSLQECIGTAIGNVMPDRESLKRNLHLLRDINAGLWQKVSNLTGKDGAGFDRSLPDGWRMEYTSAGLPTICACDVQKKAFYFHTNNNAMEEAQLLADEWFDNECFCYEVYGMGLGYHIKALLDKDECVEITVYESNLYVIAAAAVYTDLWEWMSDGRVKLVYDPDFKQISGMSGSTKPLLIHYPSLRAIRNAELREQMEDYFIQYSSMKTQLTRLNACFFHNIQEEAKSIGELETVFRHKDLYIIAAGPSLDKNMHELKNIVREGIIMATGTVLRKLLDADIRPDYVIIIDAGKDTWKQIQGLEQCGIPLLYLSTVYYKIPEAYKGKKYRILQSSYKKAEEYAGRNGLCTYESGGSVSTTALEIGIRFGCRRIIFVGLDLAYTDGFDHASKTQERKQVDGSTGKYTEDINGGLVPTGYNLDIYRKWIEKRIGREPGLLVIDATEGGARIKGTEVRKLSDIVGEGR